MPAATAWMSAAQQARLFGALFGRTVGSLNDYDQCMDVAAAGPFSSAAEARRYLVLMFAHLLAAPLSVLLMAISSSPWGMRLFITVAATGSIVSTSYATKFRRASGDHGRAPIIGLLGMRWQVAVLSRETLAAAASWLSLPARTVIHARTWLVGTTYLAFGVLMVSGPPPIVPS